MPAATQPMCMVLMVLYPTPPACTAYISLVPPAQIDFSPIWPVSRHVGMLRGLRYEAAIGTRVWLIGGAYGTDMGCAQASLPSFT